MSEQMMGVSAASVSGATKRAARSRIVVKQFADLRVQRGGRDRIKGLIPGGPCLVLVYGPSGSGKTYLVGHAGFCIASGTDFLDHFKTASGLVVYVAAEAPAGVESRLAAQRDELGVRHANLVVLAGEIDLLDRSFCKSLLAVLAELHEQQGPLDTVIIDTIAQAAPGGDENSGETMGQIVSVGQRIRDHFSCAVIGVHHEGKTADRGPRGHSSLHAAVDVEIKVSDTGTGVRIAEVTKMRDGASGAQVAFRLRPVVIDHDEDGEAITSCLVELAEQTSARRERTTKLPAAASLALDALREVASTKGKPSTATSAIPAGKSLVAIEDWREQFRLRYGSDGQDGEAIKKAFQRARERLAGDRIVGMHGGQAWIW